MGDDEMPRNKGQPMKRTSVRINPDLHKICVEYGISFSRAVERGAIILLKERKEFLNITDDKKVLEDKQEEKTEENNSGGGE